MKLIRSFSAAINSQLKDMYFVGRLATKKEIMGTNFLRTVSFQDEYNEFIQFNIKCLSKIPVEISDHFSYQNNLFVGSTRSKVNERLFNSILSDKGLTQVEKRDSIEKFLQNKLILFQMIATSPDYIHIDIKASEEVNSFVSEYTLIPTPELKIGETKLDFEKRILKGSSPFVLPAYPKLFDPPSYIYLQDRLYTEFTLKETANPFTYVSKNKEIKIIDSDKFNFKDYIAISLNNLVYAVDSKLIYRLDGLERISLTTDVEKNTSIDSVILEETDNVEEELINVENLFLDKLYENALKQGLLYSKEDLYNFHTCIKTNMLTIIGGMSGIGKTKLAMLYAETLGLDLGKEVLLIPVSPAYTEPNDVMGYLNTNTGIYNESETGLVSLLRSAEIKEDDKLYMVIFDEMNLSQVEHWFSPFMSLLEMPPEKRFLTLFNENSHCVNKYPSKVKIGANILFIGTVNFDETTKTFSDRLMDRANIFTPNKPSLEELYNKSTNITFENNEIEPIYCNSETFYSWRKQDGVQDFKIEEILILDKLHNLINNQDRQKGVSFRTARSIASYLNNIPVDSDGSPVIQRERAFDLQIKQRIITKIRGMEAFVRPLVGEYIGEQFEPGNIITFLTSNEVRDYYNNIEEDLFKETIELLESKAKELSYYGFVY